jgi:WD40 repeat protein
LSWSPDNKYLLSSSQDFKAILWDVSTGSSILTIKEHNDAVSNGLEFITASTDMQMILWRMNGML